MRELRIQDLIRGTARLIAEIESNIPHSEEHLAEMKELLEELEEEVPMTKANLSREAPPVS